MATSAVTARHVIIAKELAASIRHPLPEDRKQAIEGLMVKLVSNPKHSLAIAVLAFQIITNQNFDRAFHTWLDENFEEGHEAGFYVFDLKHYHYSIAS